MHFRHQKCNFKLQKNIYLFLFRLFTLRTNLYYHIQQSLSLEFFNPIYHSVTIQQYFQRGAFQNVGVFIFMGCLT